MSTYIAHFVAKLIRGLGMNDLAGAISRLNANFMDLTPTVASLLNPKDVPTIKGLALGGEALTKAVVEQWAPYVHVMGQYGPSEASVNSAFKSFEDFKKGDDPTNIGRAVGSVSWVVDPGNRNRLAPIGCKGELLIEGPILARGYLRDPEKTALAFIKDPAWARTSDGKSRRFYCTGMFPKAYSCTTQKLTGCRGPRTLHRRRRIDVSGKER